jgi:hypothetical protein
MRQLHDPQVAAALGRAAYDRFWAGPFSSLNTHIDSLQGIYEGVLQRSKFKNISIDLYRKTRQETYA